jgi:hypothetical protein
MSEPVRCNCSGKGWVFLVDVNPSKWQVWCGRSECWQGPIRRSKRAAINAWNRVMQAARDAKEQR